MLMPSQLMQRKVCRTSFGNSGDAIRLRVIGILEDFNFVLVCDMYIDLPRKLWSPKLDQALHAFVLKGGFLAFLGGEPFAKHRIFQEIFGLSWRFAGEVGGSCVKSARASLPRSAPELLDGMKLMPLTSAPEQERIYVMETERDWDSASEASETTVESETCGVARAQQGLGSIVNLGEMRYEEEGVASWWDALLCILQEHAPKAEIPFALDLALSKGVQDVEDDDDQVIADGRRDR